MSNTVSGNYIGTDASGSAALGNTYEGVNLGEGAQHNTIGGDTADERNVISGNGEEGVLIEGSDVMSNTVSGNYIGTDANGAAALGNTYDGVAIHDAQHNVIGGDTEGERNVISGNGWEGISIYGSGATGNTVSGNTIGTDASGATDLGNAYDGVAIYEAQHNTIGSGNIIAYNGYDGVEVNGSTTGSNTITQNSIFSNAMGIDLVSGANWGIAAPVIVSHAFGSPVSVVGTTCAGCTVELFANDDTDGEGETFIGDTVADGSGAFTITAPVGPVATKPYLTATATDVVSGTSEFSAVYTVKVTAIYLPLVQK